jgi:hypothetical protein
MAAALESQQQAALEEDSKNPSLNPLDDVEKTQLSDMKETTDGNGHGFQRPVSGFKWFLVCFGLYLGAVLYGEDFPTVSINRKC